MANPSFVAFAFFAALGEPGQPDVELLRRLVTPESLSNWGDFTEVSQWAANLSITSRAKPAVGSTDVSYVALLAHQEELGEVRTPDEHMIAEAAGVLSLQRRPDLDGEWRVHAVGRYVTPEEMPPIP